MAKLEITAGVNDLFTTNPELERVWHPSKNQELDPRSLHAGSHQHAWWICEYGHETESEIRVRAKGHRCAVCSNRVVLEGFNDLLTTNPELAEEFDGNLNAPVKVTQIQVGSKPKFWWRCSKGHSFSSRVATRIKSAGCPICNNKQVLPGYNDLATTNPEIAAIWHPTKNLPTVPESVVAGSDKKVWWTCAESHEYETSVYNKCKNQNCPVCFKILLVAGVNDLQTTHPDLAKQWHPRNNGDLLPSQFTSINSNQVWWQCPEGHEYELSIKRRVKAKSCSVCSNSRLMPGLNDLQTRFPQIAARLHPTLNSESNIKSLSAMSKEKVWWICEKDPRHHYQAEIQSVVLGGGCSVCSGHQIVAGVNDLATIAPEQARFWHPTKNGDLQPTQISPHSSKKVWWVCDQGHESFASPGARTSKRVVCAVCAGKKVLTGFNDLTTTHPMVASRWHPSKNGTLFPENVNFGSGKKVWWRCQEDPRHEYQSRIYDQTSNAGNGCPICVGRLVVPGINDLATLSPGLLEEWDFSRNNQVDPATVSIGSDKKVWWVCSEGHEWRSSIKNRSRLESNCPRCSRSGYDPSLPGLFYFIENYTLQARKVGVTNPGVKNKRTEQFKKYGWTMVYSFTSENGYEVLDIETEMLRWIRKELGLPRFLDSSDMNHMGGASETFSGHDPSNSYVLQRIQEVIRQVQANHSQE